MKNSADLGGCYPPWPSASVDNTLLDLQNSSYPTQPHSITAKYIVITNHKAFKFCKAVFSYQYRFNYVWTIKNKACIVT